MDFPRQALAIFATVPDKITSKKGRFSSFGNAVPGTFHQFLPGFRGAHTVRTVEFDFCIDHLVGERVLDYLNWINIIIWMTGTHFYPGVDGGDVSLPVSFGMFVSLS